VLALTKRNLKRFAVVGTTELFDDTLRLCCLELR
jgi:hypothetical protein